MPRLEDGELLSSASKFKKRRAWIIPDDSDLSVITRETKPLAKEPLIITKVEHEHNKSRTREKHEDNKTKTRVKHDNSSKNKKIPIQTLQAKQKQNENATRVKHEYNKSVTILEQEHNKVKTENEEGFNKGVEPFTLGEFFAFLEKEKNSITHYEEDARSLILSLSDVQKRTFWHIAIECINRKVPRTGPIEIKGFFEKLLTSTPVIRTTLNRLVDKRIIQREKGKLGKNGFAIISLPKTMFDVAQEIFSSFRG